MSLSTKQRYELKKFLKDLSVHRGRHTELVSVYVPQDYDMNKVINHLSQEQGTATNIKSTSTRKNVIDALEKMIQHLRIYKKTPENGLAAFAGNIAEREGQSDIKAWSIEPPVPLKIRIYRCDKEFVLEPLEQMMEQKEVYGLVVIDRRDANIAFLKGKTIIPMVQTHSEVPGKFKAGGQCLLKDSIVQLADGSLPKIEELHNRCEVKSVIFSSNFSIDNSKITNKWNSKKDIVYKIITKNPRLEISSSKDHTFFVVSPEGIINKSAEELNKDEYLIMPEKIIIKGKVQKINSKKYYNSFIIKKSGQKILKQERTKKGLFQKELAKKIDTAQTTISSYEVGKINADRKSLQTLCSQLNINFEKFLKNHTEQHMYRNIKLPNILTKELAQFLGYLIGDGSIEEDRITFFEQNKEVALSYKAKFDKFFGIKSSYKFRESKNYHQIRFTSRPLVRLIREEFPETKSSQGSEIPQKVLNSEDKILANFIRGIFDAEGYCYADNRIALGMNNKRLIQQLQTALLRFGIISSMLEYDNRRNPYSNNPRFTLDISEGHSLILFKRIIGFTSKIKSKKLDLTIKNKTDISRVRQIIVPGKKIREMIENAGYNLAQFPKVSNFFRNKRMMSKEIFKNSVLSNVKDKKLYSKLSKICSYPILPVKISNIKKIKRNEEMIDISVKNKNFIANGIVVHNSAMRFARQREGSEKQHFKKVGEYMREQFLGNENLKGIIVGGPGPTKYDFVNGDFITNEVKKKIIAIKDLGYTGEFGLQELLDKSQDVLAKEDVAEEKKIMNRFFEMLAKQPGKVSYGKDEVMNNLKMGVVDIVLLSEALDENLIEEFEQEAKKVSSEVVIISTETREGVQLRDIGKIAAILRYDIQQ